MANLQSNTVTKPDTENSMAIPSFVTALIAESVTNENLQENLLRATDGIVDYLDATNAYIILKRPGNKFDSIASVHRGDTGNDMTTACDAMIKYVIENDADMIVDDAMQSQEFPSDPQFQRFNIKSAICAPLKANGTISGVIYADSIQQCQWKQEHLQLLSLIGSLAGLVVDNCAMHGEVKKNYRLIQTGKATLNLSHSVKNILQMIGGAAEVIDFGLKSNQIHRVMKSWDILKPNLERLRKFTLDMLDYSKERRLELDKCDFNRVIQGSIESLQAQLKQKKSKLGIRIDQNIPALELDSERIHEMSLNLILNAIDIVDDTGGIVSVETMYLEQQQSVQLSVTDNGPGMTDEMKEKIFTPFESDKNKLGTGLGMPIAKQIIDQHNGRIEIETVQGKGTTFNVILPAKIV